MGMESKDKTTFDMVYEENAEIVYKVALKYSGNHHVAEEIVQSVFIKLFVNLILSFCIALIFLSISNS